MKKIVALLMMSATAAASSAWADDAAVLRCRALADTAGRLACYDGMPVGAASAAAAPAAVAPAPTPAQVKTAQVSAFGMESNAQAVKQANQEKLASFDSAVVGHFDGWQPGSSIKLANGQVWRVSDGSDAFMNLDNPRVKVVRGALGSFFIEFEGSNKSPRVTRMQ